MFPPKASYSDSSTFPKVTFLNPAAVLGLILIMQMLVDVLSQPLAHLIPIMYNIDNVWAVAMPWGPSQVNSLAD